MRVQILHFLNRTNAYNVETLFLLTVHLHLQSFLILDLQVHFHFFVLNEKSHLLQNPTMFFYHSSIFHELLIIIPAIQSAYTLLSLENKFLQKMVSGPVSEK